MKWQLWVSGLAWITVYAGACADNDKVKDPRGEDGGSSGMGATGGSDAGGKGTGGSSAGEGGEAGEDSGSGATGGSTGTGGSSGTGGSGTGGSSGSTGGGGTGGSSGSGEGGEAGQPPVEIVTESTFTVPGSQCGIAYDHVNDSVWVYPCSGASILEYGADGSPLGSIDAPGEAANDVDLEVAAGAFSLNDVSIPEGTLLFINGETAVTEVYALDKTQGTVLSTLVTDFGTSHVVGGAYHAGRDSLFLVQDRVPSTMDNLVGELSTDTGLTARTFPLLPNFDVNYGDMAICQESGHLFFVSSIQRTVAEFTPTGSIVDAYPIPDPVINLSGIAIDPLSGEAWVSSTSGGVWQLSGLPCAPVP